MAIRVDRRAVVVTAAGTDIGVNAISPVAASPDGVAARWQHFVAPAPEPE